MDEFGLLAKDFGLRPQGKSAPMSGPKSSPSRWTSADSLHDVFGGSAKLSTTTTNATAPSFDSIFHGFSDSKPSAPSSSSMPVYDKPVYDDDIFDGVPGVRSSAGNVFDDVFASAPAAGSNRASSPPIEDLLENLGRPPKVEVKKGSGEKRSGSSGRAENLDAFEELIPGFGGGSPARKRETSETNHKQSHVPVTKSNMNGLEDPFVVLQTTSTSAYSSSGLFTDPLEHINMPMNSQSTKVDASSVNEGVFDDTDYFDRPTKSVPLFTTSEKDNEQNERNPLKNVQNTSPGFSGGKEAPLKSSMDPFEHLKPKVRTTDDHLESNDVLFEKPYKVSNSSTSFNKGGVQNSNTNERDAMSDRSPRSDEGDDVWLTVAEVPLFTQPTASPPPSRPPPPLVIKHAPTGKADHGASIGLDAKRSNNDSFWQSNQGFSERFSDSVKNSGVSPIDELENFAMGKPQANANEHVDIFSNEEEIETNSAAVASATAMKEAMDRAEVKFRQAREVRERERDAKSARHRESGQQDGEGKETPDFQVQEDREKQERLDRERRQREREEKEKEEKRRERERELELQREREKGRQAVERATREARERAGTEARLKAERAAVERANAEARQRAERAAVQKAAAEARERAAVEAREKAERVAAEARERAAAEARERVAVEAREKAAVEARERAAVERAAAEARLRAERAAVERAAAEARERAAADARERAAAAARERQHKNENDLESFFGMGARANSAPKQRATSSETVFDAQNKAGPDGMRRTSVSSSSSFRKASSTTNIVDDLTSIFGAAPSSGEFQEVEGESEERRRARLERHQRTLERTARALAEKNERDMQTQREQAERHRIAETLDIEIKRWAAGKEGNLRALLSTLQYVLWPDCGWQPVSLTDLITAASVKKVYRKATLCIHPDKVQQKGANLQQKYIAEKVFDLLKEAWNKFNSEELF